MSFNILFYQSDLDACPDAPCLDSPNNNVTMGNNVSAGDTCDCFVEGECVCLPNGLLASLFTAAVAFPVIGLLNLGFGLLRRPLTRDLGVKRGEQYKVLRRKQQEQEDTDLDGAERTSCCARSA